MDLNTILISFIFFCLGTLTLSMAGMQDKTSRKPFLLIPAFILLGASTNIMTTVLIVLMAIVSLILPDKINKVIGKADVFLFASIFIIFIFGNIFIMTMLLLMALIATAIMLVDDVKKNKTVPLITVFTKGYLASLFVLIIVGALLVLLAGVIVIVQGVI
jgi:hypothetical protein